MGQDQSREAVMKGVVRREYLDTVVERYSDYAGRTYQPEHPKETGANDELSLQEAENGGQIQQRHPPPGSRNRFRPSNDLGSQAERRSRSPSSRELLPTRDHVAGAPTGRPDTNESLDAGKSHYLVHNPGKRSLSTTQRIGQVIQKPGEGMLWYDPRANQWKPAVYHDDIRGNLIQEMQAMGTYTYGRARGMQEHDVTAYFPPHQNWGEERSNWPKIIFQYEPGPREQSTTTDVLWSTPQGQIVLDINNDPVLVYQEIPVTLSSRFEPVFMEAVLRSNRKITQKDLRARMPRFPTAESKASGKDVINRNTLSMSMTRFRRAAGCISWNDRSGSQPLKTYMDTLLPQHCKDANSTQGFRSLLPHEIAVMNRINLGLFPERARSLTPKQVERLNAKSKAKRGEGSSDKEWGSAGSEEKFRNDEGPPPVLFDLHKYAENEPAYSLSETARDSTSSELIVINGQEAPRATPFGLYKAVQKKPPTGDFETAESSASLEGQQLSYSSSTGASENGQLNGEATVFDVLEQCKNGRTMNGDFRFTMPSTEDEKLFINLLLAPSKRHFESLTGSMGYGVDDRYSYIAQLKDMQVVLNNFWKTNEQDGPAPALLGLKLISPYVGLDWNMPKRPEIDSDNAELQRLFYVIFQSDTT